MINVGNYDKILNKEIDDDKNYILKGSQNDFNTTYFFEG